jgi:hypothetical protein
MITRILTNVGNPFRDQSNDIVNGKVVIKMVDRFGNPKSNTDAYTGEVILTSVEEVELVNGEFTIDLWPTDRGIISTYYQVYVVDGNIVMSKVISFLPEGDLTDLQYNTFVSLAGQIRVQELSALQQHVANKSMHVWNYRGVWDVAAAYQVQDIVQYNNAVWLCTDYVSGIAPEAGDYWDLLVPATPGPTGAQGPPGASLVARGTWIDSVQYAVDDLVTYQYSTYRAITVPPIGDLPTSLHWEVFVGASTTIVAQDVMPQNLPIGGIWIDTSEALNYAPTIAAITNRTCLVGDSIIVDIYITDPENVAACTLSATSSVSAVIAGGDIVFTEVDSGHRIATLESLDTIGYTTITITVMDEGGLTASTSFRVGVGTSLHTIEVIQTANGTITPSGDQSVIHGEDYEFTMTPDAGYYVESITVDGGNPITGVSTYTFTNVGTDHTITAAFAVNAAPTITSISNQTVAYQTATSALEFTVGDDHTPVASLTVTATSSNTTLIPNASCVIAGANATKTITVTPANGQPPLGNTGVSTITVTVDDGSSTTDETFTVTVSPPVPSAVTNFADLESDSQVELNWTKSTRANSYTVLWGTADPPTTETADLGDVATYTKTALTNGTTYYFRVRAKNVTGNTDTTTLSAIPGNILGFESGSEGYSLEGSASRSTTVKRTGSYALSLPGGAAGAWRSKCYKAITFPSAGTVIISRYFNVTAWPSINGECQIMSLATTSGVSNWTSPFTFFLNKTAAVTMDGLCMRHGGDNPVKVVDDSAVPTNTWLRCEATINTTANTVKVEVFNGATSLGSNTESYTGTYEGTTLYSIFGWYEGGTGQVYIDDMVDF